MSSPPTPDKQAGPGRSVCLVTSFQPVTYTRFLDRIAGSLARAGYRVTLVGLEPADRGMPGVELATVPRRGGLAKRRTLAAIKEAMVAANADVYHCFDPWALELGLALKRARSVKLVYDSTESFPEVYDQRTDLFLPVRRYLASKVRRLEAEAVKSADAIVETNQTRARRFEARGRRVVLVPNYPPLEALHEPAARREPWLCWTGLASRHRGFDVLLRAFARVAPRFPAARLKVMGGFDEYEDLAAWAKEFVSSRGLAQVEFVGWQPYSRMFELLSQGLVGIILLQRGRYNDWTGQPNKLFDFMGSGLAVVAGDTPEVGWVVREAGCGLLLDPSDEQAVTAALAALLSEPEKAAKLGLAGRQAVLEKFNWTEAERVLLEMYQGFLR